uniref:Saposin B-type domain-containing protein n=1 Tax=Strongyloides papillosus TaxID=174720 RepID=A0A0N5CA94_STREA
MLSITFKKMKFLVFFLLLTLNVLLTFEQKPLCNPCTSFFDKIQKLNQEGVNTADKLKNMCYEITLGSQILNVICKRIMVRNLDTITQEIKTLKDSNAICRKVNFC